MSFEISWVPKACKPKPSEGGEGLETPPKFNGYLKLRPPSFAERLRHQAKAAQLIGKNEEGVQRTVDSLMIAAEFAEEAFKIIAEVKIETADGLLKANTAEELFCQSEFDEIVAELSEMMIRGFMGNSKSR